MTQGKKKSAARDHATLRNATGQNVFLSKTRVGTNSKAVPRDWSHPSIHQIEGGRAVKSAGNHAKAKRKKKKLFTIMKPADQGRTRMDGESEQRGGGKKLVQHRAEGGLFGKPNRKKQTKRRLFQRAVFRNTDEPFPCFQQRKQLVQTESSVTAEITGVVAVKRQTQCSRDGGGGEKARGNGGNGTELEVP